MPDNSINNSPCEQVVPSTASGVTMINAVTGQELIDMKQPTGPMCPVSQFIMTAANSGDRKTAVTGFLYGVILEVDNRETLP